MSRLAGGIALLMVSVFMLIGFLAGGGRTHGLGIEIFTFALVVVTPGVTGLALLRQHLRQVPPAPPTAPALPVMNEESRIVRLAEEKAGRLTVIEVVGELGLGAEAAEAFFADLVARDMADIEMTDSGLTVYVFRDILKLKDKGTSHDLLAEG